MSLPQGKRRRSSWGHFHLVRHTGYLLSHSKNKNLRHKPSLWCLKEFLFIVPDASSNTGLFLQLLQLREQGEYWLHLGTNVRHSISPVWVCVFVCVYIARVYKHICMCTAVYMCIGMCVGQRSTLGIVTCVLRQHFSLGTWHWLTGQWVSGIHQFPPLQLWDYKQVPPHLAFFLTFICLF